MGTKKKIRMMKIGGGQIFVGPTVRPKKDGCRGGWGNGAARCYRWGGSGGGRRKEPNQRRAGEMRH